MDELHSAVSHCPRVRRFVIWRDDNGNLIDVSPAHFVDDNAENGFFVAIAVNDGLEGKGSLVRVAAVITAFGMFMGSVFLCILACEKLPYLGRGVL